MVSFYTSGFSVSGSFKIRIRGRGCHGTYTVFALYGSSEAIAHFDILEKAPPSNSANLKASALARKGSTMTSITIASPAAANNNKQSIYEFDIELPDGANIQKASTPKGWQSDIDGNTVIFTTDDKPLDPGKWLTFRIYSHQSFSTLSWSAYDGDGNTVDESETTVRLR